MINWLFKHSESGVLLTLTSTWEMLPMTLFWLSRTGSEVMPSLFMSSRASVRGLSPLSRRISSQFFQLSQFGPAYLIAKTEWEPMFRSLIN